MKKILLNNPISRILKAKYSQRLVDYMATHHLLTILEKDYHILRFQSFGDACPNRNVYLIKIDDTSGFFALYLWVLGYLLYAEAFNLEPVIIFSTSTALHDPLYSKELGSSNSFEYYFKSLNATIDTENFNCKNVVVAQTSHLRYVQDQYNISFNYRYDEPKINVLAKIMKHHIHLNDKTQAYLDKSLKTLPQDKPLIGVHFRGTDFRHNLKNHPTFSQEDAYFEVLDSLFERHLDHRIFLATEDGHSLKKFVERYGERIIYYQDVLRSTNQTIPLFEAHDRTFHQYHAGLEVLKDVYTLSHCDILIGGMSNVTTAARIFKASRGESYQEVHILHQGLNSNSRTLEDVDDHFKKLNTKQ